MLSASWIVWLCLYSFWGCHAVLSYLEYERTRYFDPDIFDKKDFFGEHPKSKCFCPDDIDLPLIRDPVFNDDPRIPKPNLSCTMRNYLGRESVRSSSYVPTDVIFWNGKDTTLNDDPFDPETDVLGGCTDTLPMGEHPKSKCYHPDDFIWQPERGDTINFDNFLTDFSLRWDPKDLFDRESTKSECYCPNDIVYSFKNDTDINEYPIIPEFDFNDIYEYYAAELSFQKEKKNKNLLDCNCTFNFSEFDFTSDNIVFFKMDNSFLELFYILLGAF